MSKINFDNFLDNDSFGSFDRKTNDINSIFNDANTQFEECFTKIFEENKLIDIDSDIENEDWYIKNRKQNANYYFMLKEKSDSKNNSINLNNSNEKSEEKAEEKEKDFNHVNESNNNDRCFSSNNIIQIEYDNKEENDYINLNEEERQENDENHGVSFLGKKRNLFKIICSKDFAIFNLVNHCQYSREIIDDVYNNFYEDEINKNKKNEVNDNEINNGKKRRKIRKKKNAQKRKDNSDNIRKKIKARFLKVLKNSINEKLKVAGSRKFFNFLPQAFICNVSKDKNKDILDLTFKEVFSKKFCEEDNESDLKKYYHNLSVLEYLENNKEISEKSNFNVIKNMKYSQIFDEYLKSYEFEMEIASLKSQKENDKYIRNYIIKARSFIDFINH